MHSINSLDVTSDIIKSNFCIHLYKPAAVALVSAFHSVPLKISLSRIFAICDICDICCLVRIFKSSKSSDSLYPPCFVNVYKFNCCSSGITDATISENFSNLFGELLKNSEITLQLSNISLTTGTVIILITERFSTCEKQ